jgi:sugar lactone lactonase YvrE
MRRISKVAVALAAATAAALLFTPGGHAVPDALKTYVVPGQCVQPESVTVRDGYFYTGGICNGNIYRGDLRERRAEVFVPGGATTLQAGIKATATRLVVTGIRNGRAGARVYNRFTGKLLAQFLASRQNPIVNDVAIAPNGDAYLTDFTQSQIYRIPAAGLNGGQSGVQRLRVFLDFRGTSFPVQEGSANGIAVTSDGRFLIVTHFSAGRLYRVRLSDGQVRRIDLHGQALAGPDGITLTESNVLYVVEANKSRVAEVRLSHRYGSGRVVSRTTSPGFQCPTSAAIAGDRLLVANSQFCGPNKPPYTIASIPLP